MATAQSDNRSPERRAKDEQIAGETPLSQPDIPADAVPVPLEKLLSRERREPVAVAGVVENGVVRPLDPAVKLPEHARVIIVAAGAQ